MSVKSLILVLMISKSFSLQAESFVEFLDNQDYSAKITLSLFEFNEENKVSILDIVGLGVGFNSLSLAVSERYFPDSDSYHGYSSGDSTNNLTIAWELNNALSLGYTRCIGRCWVDDRRTFGIFLDLFKYVDGQGYFFGGAQ